MRREGRITSDHGKCAEQFVAGAPAKPCPRSLEPSRVFPENNNTLAVQGFHQAATATARWNAAGKRKPKRPARLPGQIDGHDQRSQRINLK
jgi:hypothetical protein